MAFGNTSKAFAYAVLVIGEQKIKIAGTTPNTFKFALFGNTVVPANTVTTKALSSYTGTTSTWSTAHEVSGTGYTAGGKTISSPTWTQTTTHLVWTSATNLSWTASSFTAYGGLVYDSTTGTTTLDQGLCYLSFGGAQTVTSGTFTVAWSATGILRFNC